MREIQKINCITINQSIFNKTAEKFFLVKMMLFVSAVTGFNVEAADSYDGRSRLSCGLNVRCANQADVVAKMKVRWVAYSSKTNYSNPCFQAINRVQRINAQVWDIGMAQQQMEVCNMQ
jgi:hypothetical protein